MDNTLLKQFDTIYKELDLSRYIEKDVIYLAGFFELKELDEVMLFIITIIDAANIMESVFTLEDSFRYCHETGFYTEEAVNLIIEDIVKTDKCMFSGIYKQAMALIK